MPDFSLIIMGHKIIGQAASNISTTYFSDILFNISVLRSSAIENILKNGIILRKITVNHISKEDLIFC